MLKRPRTLVILRYKAFYLAKYALADWFGIVETVTKNTSRVHPISEDQLTKIRRVASKLGIEVKIASDLEEIKSCFMRGECEPLWQS
jgi:hypothetical protein